MSVREVSPFPLSEGQALEYPAAIVWHSPDNLLSFWMGQQTLFLCKSLWRDEWYAKWNRRKKILLICIIIAGERGMPTLCQCSTAWDRGLKWLFSSFDCLLWALMTGYELTPQRFWGLMSGFLKQKERCGHLKNLATTSNVSLNQAKTLILMSARVLQKTSQFQSCSFGRRPISLSILRSCHFFSGTFSLEPSTTSSITALLVGV